MVFDRQLLSGIAFSFVVFLLDHHRSITPLNVEAEVKKEQQELAKEFDKLGEGQNDGG